MDWLFENLGKLAPLVLFLLYMLSSLKGRGEEEEAPDPQASERARKIQEDIRRKILERQREGRGELVEPPEVEREDDLVAAEEERPTWYRPDVREAQEAQEELEYSQQKSAPAVGAFPVEEYKDAFAEQKREIEAREAEVRSLLEDSDMTLGEVSLAPPVETLKRRRSSAIRAGVRRGLQGPISLKTSFVLKEILDRPIGTR